LSTYLVMSLPICAADRFSTSNFRSSSADFCRSSCSCDDSLLGPMLWCFKNIFAEINSGENGRFYSYLGKRNDHNIKKTMKFTKIAEKIDHLTVMGMDAHFCLLLHFKNFDPF
jgi:hypothetical protein